MEASSPVAGAAPGKQYVLFDQFGSRGTMMLHCESAADGQPKLLARYDASDVLRSPAFAGAGAGEMLEMVCGGRREQLVGLQESTTRLEDKAIAAQASTAETSSSSWREDSQEIEALIMESDDDEDGSVTSRLAHSSIALGDQSDGEGSVASGAEQLFWDDSLLSVCSAPRWNEVRKRRLRKRMKVLRSWVPGGNKLDTIRVLEEVIRYIRSSQQQIERNIQY